MINTDDLFENTRFLEIYHHKYVLKSTNSSDCVVIDLMSGNISKENVVDGQEKIKSLGIKAVYGIVELSKGKYLMVATKSNLIGQIYNKHIFNLSQMEFFPITADKLIKSQDQKYIDMMQSWFKTKTFYFSETYDLTNNFQRFIKNQTDINKFNSAFCYNECYMAPFFSIGAYDWICPFISGYISIKYFTLEQNGCDFVLISRRDKRRCGTRFWSRGADLDGNVTNMAETEQLLILNKDVDIIIYSYAQTRGSMPFLWSSQPDMRWAPKGKIIGDKNVNADIWYIHKQINFQSKKHFDDQLQNFSKQLCVNLVDKNKSKTQRMLGEYFEEMVNLLQFHHECRNMKWENLSKLMDLIGKDIQAFGYFEFSYQKSKPLNAKVSQMQKGVIRTNCMDCLDRTNVVQSVIARNIFLNILNYGQGADKNPFQKFPDKLEEIFRENWTINADVISTLYSGTGALKTDFTRTGKRTTSGAIQDARNSIHRYILNNFSDGHKQDTLDVLLKKVDVKQKSVSKPLNRVFVTGVIAFLLFQVISATLYSFVSPFSASTLNQILSSGQQTTAQNIAEYAIFLVSIGMLAKLLQVLNGFLVPKPIKC